jgi:hypothetical protein
MTIECRGRNGWFNYHGHSTDCYDGSTPSGLRAWVWIFSSSPHTKTAPMQFTGDPLPIIRLLRRVARDLERDYRVTKQLESEENQ